MTMKFELPKDQMQDIVSAAILQTLDDEKRAALIGEAIKYLMTAKQDRGYGYGQTPLQEAFQSALYAVAREVVTEQIKADPEIRVIIADMFRKAWVIVQENDNYASNLASNIANILAPK